MKNSPFLFIILILCSCHQSATKKSDISSSDTPQAISEKNSGDSSVSSANPGADTVNAKGPEMLMLNNERADLALFCVYGAELVAVVPVEKHGFDELVRHPESMQDIAARSKVKMSGPNDIEHAIWTGKCMEDSTVVMKTALEKDSIHVVYSFKGDTITVASTIRKGAGRSTTIVTKRFWLSGIRNFNNTVQAVNRQLIGMVQR